MAHNSIVLLLGFPGTGKLTTARALAPLIGAKVVYSHWINNPIFGLIEPDGKTPLPVTVWDRTNEVQRAVMETIATLAKPMASFIFTYYGVEDEPYDAKSYELMRDTARRRGALFVPVRLLCSEVELRKRIISPERKENLKTINPGEITKYQRQTLFNPNHPNQLTLDVSALAPSESARAIAAHIRELGGQISNSTGAD